MGRRSGAIVLSGTVLVVAWAVAVRLPSVEGVPPVPSDPLIVWQIPAGAGSPDPCLTGRDPAGVPSRGRIVLITAPTLAIADLTPGFAAVGLPDLSRDARHLLFVGRRHLDDPAAVWELSLIDRGVHRVVDCPGGCDRALYLPAIYTMDDETPVEQIAIRSRSGSSVPPALFRCGLDGHGLRQITFAPDGVFEPLLLGDGRLLVFLEAPSDDRTAQGPQAAHRAGGTRLLTVNTDGTDSFLFHGSEADWAARHSPTETRGGTVFFLEEAPDEATLVAVRRADPTRIARATRLVSPCVRRLVAWTDEAVLAAIRAPDDAPTYAVGRVNIETGDSAVVFDDPAFHDIPAAIAVPRQPAPGRSSVVRETTKFGQIYALDTYITGSDAPSIPKGGVARIRVHSRSSAGDSQTVLGEAEVERDGSFFVEVPAQTPLALEMLDPAGRTIRQMESYFWVMPGERRGCIGCHENRALAPPNRHAFALRKPPQRIGFEDQSGDSDTVDRPEE